MKFTNLFTTTALVAAFAAGAASAQEAGLGSSSFSAGVSLLSPEQTGFLYSGTVEAQGLGSGAVVISAQDADFNMTGFANSGKATADEAGSNSGVLTTFDFGRTVTASASSVGAGRVVAQGDASAAVGAVGSAFGDTLVNTIGDIDGGTAASSSNATSESAASLVGEGSTSVLAGLIGTSAGFVGSTGTTVSTAQSGIAYSALNALGDFEGSGINIGPGAGATFGDLATEMSDLEGGEGIVGFKNTLSLGSSNIELAVANVGGGTVSLGATTGGFFGGGAATDGTSGFNFSFNGQP